MYTLCQSPHPYDLSCINSAAFFVALIEQSVDVCLLEQLEFINHGIRLWLTISLFHKSRLNGTSVGDFEYIPGRIPSVSEFIDAVS